MKKITDSYVKKHLKSAVEQLLHDKAEEIWEQPAEKAAGDEWFLDGTKAAGHRRSIAARGLGMAAACFAIGIFSYYMLMLNSQAVVYLDVNPGIQLELNSRDRVISAKAADKEGKMVLENMDLRQTELDVAVNAVLESMVRQGYLSEKEDMILLSVDSSDRKKGDQLREKLVKKISTCMNSMVGSASVFDQEVFLDQKLQDAAEKYGITPGKANLIQKLVTENPDLREEELVHLSIRELAEKLRKEGIDLREYAAYTGREYPEVCEEEKEPDDEDTEDSDLEEEAEEREESAGTKTETIKPEDREQKKEDGKPETDAMENKKPEQEKSEQKEPEQEEPEQPEQEEPEQEEPEWEEPEQEEPEQEEPEQEEPEGDTEEEED